MLSNQFLHHLAGPSLHWDGRPLTPQSGYLAFQVVAQASKDTFEIPKLLALEIDDGDQTRHLEPGEVPGFVKSHPYVHWVGQDCANQFWAIEHHLRKLGDEQARLSWWSIADLNRLHDPALLDALIRLAEHGDEPSPWDLGLGDLKTLLTTYQELRRRARALLDGAAGARREMISDARQRFGLLTEAIQVKKAIALAQIARNGIGLDLDRLRKTQDELQTDLLRQATAVQGLRAVYRTDSAGAIALDVRGIPRVLEDALRSQLAEIKNGIEQQDGVLLDIPTRAQGLSTAARFWTQFAGRHPFLTPWLRAQELTTLVRSCAQIIEGATTSPSGSVCRIHPTYRTLVRSGRTACARPNLQAVPRHPAIRRAFVAAPGHLLLAADYKCLELRTFAATALHRFGYSAMAEALKAGRDPHAMTAALLLGVSYEQFESWRADESLAGDIRGSFAEEEICRCDLCARTRQAAKAINFGIINGLGAAGIVESASDRFGAALELHQAIGCRQQLIEMLYPELAQYLAGDTTSQESLAPQFATTLSGRLRGHVTYTQARSTPIQGLGADGAGLALFELIREGFRVVGFIHDEVIIELPDRGGWVPEAEVRRVQELLCLSMEKVLVGDIPVECTLSLSSCYKSGGSLVIRGGKAFAGAGAIGR